MLLNGLVNVALWNIRVTRLSKKTKIRGSIKFDFQVDNKGNFSLLSYRMLMRILLACMSVHSRYTVSTEGDWKRVSDHLKLEIQAVVSYHVDAGSRT